MRLLIVLLIIPIIISGCSSKQDVALQNSDQKILVESFIELLQQRGCRFRYRAFEQGYCNRAKVRRSGIKINRCKISARVYKTQYLVEL